MTRKEWTALVLSLAWLIGASALTWLLGVAGYRAGWAIVLAVLFAGTAAVASVLIGRAGGNRTWVVSLAIFGILVGAWQIDNAPLSKHRLAQALDSFKMDFYELEQETRSGHSWCVPRCPTVTRVYKAPLTTPVLAKEVVASAASYHGFLPDFLRVVNDRRSTGFEAVSSRVTLKQTVVRRSDHLEVTITMSSHRGKKKSVPPARLIR